MTAAPAPIRRIERQRASAALDYPFNAPAPDGSVVEVAPGILWARMPMPMALDHINVYLLRDGEGWTVVDTGLNLPDGRALWEQIAATRLDGLPIRRLVCTHSHHDHAGLAAWIMERFDAELYMSHGEYFMLRHYAAPPPDPLPPLHQGFYLRAGLSAEQIEHMFGGLRRNSFAPPVPQCYRRLRDGDRLTIGTREWQVVVGEGHSPEHVCLYNASERILLAGDQLLPRITSNVLVTPFEPEANPLGLWLASLDRLKQLAEDTLILPSHQGVFRGLHARVQELHAHHGQQFDLLLRSLQERGPATAWELMQVQFPKRRGAMDDLMAMGESIAHLNWLRQQGLIRRWLHDDGCHRFERMPVVEGMPQAYDFSETHE